MNQNRVITKKESATGWLVALLFTFCTLGAPLKAVHTGVIGEKDTVIILFNAAACMNTITDAYKTPAFSAYSGKSVDTAIPAQSMLEGMNLKVIPAMCRYQGLKRREEPQCNLSAERYFSDKNYLTGAPVEMYLYGKLSLPLSQSA
jgi:hypothetical protein